MKLKHVIVLSVSLRIGNPGAATDDRIISRILSWFSYAAFCRRVEPSFLCQAVEGPCLDIVVAYVDCRGNINYTTVLYALTKR